MREVENRFNTHNFFCNKQFGSIIQAVVEEVEALDFDCFMIINIDCKISLYTKIPIVVNSFHLTRLFPLY